MRALPAECDARQYEIKQNIATMEWVILTVLIVVLLTGSSQEQDILPPGPIYGTVGLTVLFNTITPPQLSDVVTWSFMNKSIVIFTPTSEDILPEYRERVSLNKTTGSLELRVLTMADSGVYSLTYTTDTLSQQGHISLEVFELVSEVSITGPEYILIENSSTQLACMGNGTVITTEWMKDDQILFPSTRFTFSADNRTLTISPVKRSDSGEYGCRLSNPVSSDTANYTMTVSYGPDVKILGSKVVEEGSDILLLCSSASQPAAMVTWTVNGASAGDSPLYVVESSNLSHSGEYTCTAWNNVTDLTASAAVFLTVEAAASGLSPGAAAGIAVGVILGVELLIGILCFLIVHFKSSADPAHSVRKQSMDYAEEDKQNRDGRRRNSAKPEDKNNSTAFKVQGPRYEEPLQRQPQRKREPIYENEKPRLPPDTRTYCSSLP
ncbi:cell adhesion molecule CEACAM8-like isoform X3 [Brachyhypopomus gauderio]|uniref:cell adhesion molecule CEACAM8-like isoform X3 n=1 Tax=Brachyhypopomus gauderio TaxID=698409 RepID=UPI004041C5A6